MNVHLRILIFSLLATLMMSCSGSPSYLSFINRDQAFYEKVASACEEIRTNTPAGLADDRKVLPQALTLSAVIRDLNPSYLCITAERVHLSFGVGRGGYGVSWELGGDSWWKLTVYAESLERTVFTKQKL